MATNESKYRKCIERGYISPEEYESLMLDAIERNHASEQRTKALLAFLSKCAVNVYRAETIEDARKVATSMADLVANAWTDMSYIDYCNVLKEE